MVVKGEKGNSDSLGFVNKKCPFVIYRQQMTLSRDRNLIDDTYSQDEVISSVNDQI